LKFFGRWAKRRARPSGDSRDPAPFDPKEQEELAREEKFYGIDQLAALNAQGLMKALMIHRPRPIYAQLKSLGEKYSMLHPDLLTVLYYLAKHAEGNILEIGPFLGGSTMATAIGLRERSRGETFVTVEKGNEKVPSRLVTDDIVRDLKQNLLDNGLAPLVQVVVGFSLAKETVAAVRAHLPPRSVNILVVDADGDVRGPLDVYHELLADQCWVVIDDYFASGIAAKKIRPDKAADRSGGGCGRAGRVGILWLGHLGRQVAPFRPGRSISRFA